jgi:hypothetical protein
MFEASNDPDVVRSATEEELSRSEEHLRTTRLPTFGLPATWTGERQTGASSVHRSSSLTGELGGSVVRRGRQSS